MHHVLHAMQCHIRCLSLSQLQQFFEKSNPVGARAAESVGEAGARPPHAVLVHSTSALLQAYGDPLPEVSTTQVEMQKSRQPPPGITIP
jgi:hypothetical protein